MPSINETMFFNSWAPSSRLAFWVGVGGVVIGIAAGWLAGAKPLYLGLVLGAVAVVIYFFADFERAVLGLLILRSSIDSFNAAQLPAAFALGLDALTLLYVTVMLLTRQNVRTDWFWWFFAGWWVVQGLWVILLPLGGLGFDAEFLLDSIREWVRLFSWLMVYLLIMQLQNRLPPEKVISTLFLSLVIPITVAVMQMFLPSLLPAFLSPIPGDGLGSLASVGARIRGTIGHPNGFATFLLLFIGLTWWKLGQSTRRWPWLVMLGLLAFLFVSTKALFALMMLGVFVLVLIAPKLSLPNLINGVLLLTIVIVLFAGTDFGRQRIGSIANTPLLNPNIDISRAILLSNHDHNSFNWRIAQWTYLLKAWHQFPILGYGLGTSIYVSTNKLLPHNDYIRSLVEGGIVGLVLFMAFFGAQVVRLVWLLQHAPRGSAQRDLCWILLAILLSIPVGMITENIWSHTLLFFYWWTLFGVAGWDWNEFQPSKSPVAVGPPEQLLSRNLKIR